MDISVVKAPELGDLVKRHVLSRIPVYGFRKYKDAILPPMRLRTGGRHFAADHDYITSANRECDRLIRHMDLDENSEILDVGCGAGRLPIGILNRNFQIRRYHGVDVDRDRILWCQANLSRRHPEFIFEHLDVGNARYNPTGNKIEPERLSFVNNRYSIIYLYSVFSHMLTDDVESYLRAFRKILRPGGTLFVTAFVEDNVPDEEENPQGYGPIPWVGPLHCVRFNRAYFEKLVERNGFVVKKFDHGTETDEQSAYYLG